MVVDTILSLLDLNLETDPLTGIVVDTGLVEVEVSPNSSTSVDLLGNEIVGVDLLTGTTVDVLGSEIVDLDVEPTAFELEVVDELAEVDLAEGIVGIEVAGIGVEVDLSEGVLLGIGEELMFADLTEGVAIATELLADSGIEIPLLTDI